MIALIMVVWQRGGFIFVRKGYIGKAKIRTGLIFEQLIKSDDESN